MTLRVLTSMATAELISELAAPGVVSGLPALAVESAGGVVVADRVRAGEIADIVVLGAGALERLAGDGVLRGEIVPLFVSETVIATAEGAAPPDLSTLDALRETLAAARAIGYSTGPSGDGLLAVVDRLGLRDELAGRLVCAPAGTPVGSLLTSGRVDLAVQQRSELERVPGLRVVGPLPGEAAIRTTFAGAVPVSSTRAELAATALERLHDPGDAALTEIVHRHGMEPHRP